MNDLDFARKNLKDHRLSLYKDGNSIISDKRGIRPWIDFIKEGINLEGYSVSDVIVGKAASLLMVKAKIKEVYAEVLSINAQKIFKKYNIKYSYGKLTTNIINRDGTDICPMEKVTQNIDDYDEAYKVLSIELEKLSKNK